MIFYPQLTPKLDSDTAVVLGMGNVALDVARVLLTPIDILRVSQISFDKLIRTHSYM